MAPALDGYSLKARYLPAFIVVLPVWLAFAVWFPPDKQFIGVFASTGVTLVIGTLLAHLGRDGGKKRQKALFREWGGLPTTMALSYRSRIVNHITLARCHAILKTLIPNIKLPTDADEEKANWTSAKQNYESAADFLREATRDKKKFNLIYAENVGYGFRRNLWGMKPAGITICLFAIAAVNVHIARLYMASNTIQGVDAASVLLDGVLFVLWVFRFTKPWVKLTADAYSSRLVAAAEVLNKGNGTEARK
jgi:hypothetical protein